MSELRRLVRNKKAQFIWTDAHKKEFQDLKLALLNSPCRGFPIYDFNNPNISPLILSTDFSSFVFSAILSQIQINKEILLAYAARKTTAVEQSFGLIKFEKFLSMSSYFFLVTDAMSPKWLVTMKTSSKLFLRWSTQFSASTLNFCIDAATFT